MPDYTAGSGANPRAALVRGALGIVLDRAVLGQILSDLRARNYRVAAFDCRPWDPTSAADQLAEVLAMPPSLPRNLSTVGSWLSELARTDNPYGEPVLRLALVLGVYDDFLSRHRPEALSLLDAIAQATRMARLFDHRIVPLVQSDDPELTLGAVPTVVLSSREAFRMSLWPQPPADGGEA